MQHPVKKVFITQGFGENPDVYSRFGYKGHNGIDYRAFNPEGNRVYTGEKSEIIAPHNGKVMENALDSDGYGWYIKIENDKEGSILAHMSSQSPRKVGDEVKEGDFVGYQGTTGFSSGIHLHWGWYLKPRNRQNGYGGMIDPLPYLQGDNMSEDTERLKKDLAEQQKQTGLLQEQVEGLIKDNKAWEKKYEECDGKRRTAEDNAEGFRKQLKDFVSELATIFNTRHETVEIIAQAKQAITFEDKADELDRKLKAEEIKHAEEVRLLKEEIEKLKTDLASLQIRVDKTSKKADNLEKPPIVVTKPPLTFWELVRSIWLKKNSPKSIE